MGAVDIQLLHVWQLPWESSPNELTWYQYARIFWTHGDGSMAAVLPPSMKKNDVTVPFVPFILLTFQVLPLPTRQPFDTLRHYGESRHHRRTSFLRASCQLR
ncbi:hypothetical protein Hypma_001368 [Hypsizygus marmoreus]|uniref:Uncharacterized protein n=1 Tax=Hypsizygus marmoreus TaxID=39966 RepID=A0A369K5X8_HYPMA|nr:hypothetical protein Hypma_001368 [Hypsizygus marmoreus]